MRKFTIVVKTNNMYNTHNTYDTFELAVKAKLELDAKNEESLIYPANYISPIFLAKLNEKAKIDNRPTLALVHDVSPQECEQLYDYYEANNLEYERLTKKESK